MTSQSTLFDVGGAIRARDEAIDRVEAHAPDQWRTTALMIVRWIALTREQFTTDTVWQVLVNLDTEVPHENRAMGAVMRQAARNYWIEKTDRTRCSARPACHRRPLAIWQSLLFGQAPVGNEARAIYDIYDELMRA